MIPVYIGYCAVFKVREEAQARSPAPGTRRQPDNRRRAGLSKLSSMQPAPHTRCGPALQVRSTFLVRMLASSGDALRPPPEWLDSPGEMPDGDPVALHWRAP